MSTKLVIALFAASLIIAAGPGALADGILLPLERLPYGIVVPDKLFTVKYHHVRVDINDQLATTKVDQVFRNETGVEREGMYVFPMPEGSAITKFSMFAGEQEIKGEILDKDEARRIYESIVRQRKDPAILEYIDRNTFRARVYPIPANGEKRIRLDYSEVVGKSGNTCRYVYPLSTERFSARPLEDCKVTIKIRSKRAITNVYSPTHALDVDRYSDHETTVTWEARNVRPDTDLILYYTVSNDDIGIDLIAHRISGEKGFYMLLASPRVEIDKSKIQPKKVVFVLDRTGSMSGKKIEQARKALKFCLNSLRADDRFNVITFNESPHLMFDRMRKPSRDVKKKALDAVDDIDATGGTNINEALVTAFTSFQDTGNTRNYIIFLTDGLPTVGVRDPAKILENVRSKNRNNVKLFVFGLGYDVNTHLLDKLAGQNKGDADYVRPREDIEVKVSSFFAKVSDPILTDVNVKISGVKTFDAFPSADVPDIFKGSQLIVFGRYSGEGDVTVELSGTANGKRRTFKIETSLGRIEDGNDFIPQLWASRKIGYLLDEIRLHSNKELIEEVVRLSKNYGIPTEFTSFLADDRRNSVDLVASAGESLRLAEAAAEVKTGTHGVAQSANSRDLKRQTQLPQAGASSVSLDADLDVVGKVAANRRLGAVYRDANDNLVIQANVQNIARRTFYQRGDFWEDADVKEDQKFVQIKQFSDAHFKLLAVYPRLSQYSTLGNVRVVLENNQAVEIGPDGLDSLSDEELDDLLKGVPRKARASKPGSGFRWPTVVALAATMGLAVPVSMGLRRRS